MVKVGDKSVERFTEIELREVSITPMPAVPGAEVASARNDDELAEALPVRTDDDLLLIAARVALDALPVDARMALLDAYAPTPVPTETVSLATPVVASTPTSTDSTARHVTLEERVKAARSTFVLPK